MPRPQRPHVRFARPVRDLARSVKQYEQGLGFVRLGAFADHAGFDGTMLGWPDADWHLELTVHRTHPIAPSPTAEDLLVVYVPEERQWIARCDTMLEAGFREVDAHNPYWAQNGRTFADRDGYRVVVQRAVWHG